MGFNLKGTLKHNQLLLFSLLIAILLVVLLVNAELKDLVSVDVINNSQGSSSEGGGFVVSSTSGKITNGTSLTYALFDPAVISRLNLSGIININVSLIANGSHGGYINVTFGWILSQSNGSTMLNTTAYNQTFNQTRFWNYSFNTNLLPDGIYNISVYVQNVSLDSGAGISIINLSRGYAIGIDRTPPNVTTFAANFTNDSNFSSSTLPFKLEFNVTANDSTTHVTNAVFGLANGNGSESNTSAKINTTQWSVEIVGSSLGDGVYTTTPYVNDSLGNLNKTAGVITFRVDRTPPNVTSVVTNYTGDGFNFTTNRKIELNATVNDSTTYVSSVVFSLDNGNGTTFNVTGVRGAGTNLTTYVAELFTSTIREGYYTVTARAFDTLGNLNASQTVRFGFDGTAPNVSQFLINGSDLGDIINASNWTNGGSLIFNITANDSALRVESIKIGLRNNLRNVSEFNITLARNYSVFSAVMNLNTLTDGAYTLFVYANDTLNNFNNSVANLSFRIDSTPPNVSQFLINGSDLGDAINASNWTRGGVLAFNLTVNDTTLRAETVKIGLRNNLRNVSEFNITLARNYSVFSAVMNLNTLTDGTYTLFVYANDTLNNFNNSVSNLSFRIDSTSPNVTNVIVNNLTAKDYYNMSIGLSEGMLTFNATINDSTTTVQTVKFGFNSTNGTEENITVLVFAGRWNVTLNLSKLTEGAHSIKIYANDTLGNLNKSGYTTFNLDRTKPSVTVTCSPSSPTAGQTVTCTCSFSDAGTGLISGGGFNGGAGTSESTTAAGTGSFTSSTCRAEDYAGNSATATSSWTVTAASGGGGGSGGSGGGSSSGVPSQFEKKVWTSINAGETATVEVDNGAIGVTEVSFSVAETIYGAWVQVKKVDSLPSSVDAPDTTVYRTLEITQQNVQKALQGLATVKFKVEKAWLSENSVNAANVALFRFVDGAWAALPTTQGEDDGTYVHYSATTSGFSYFVIGEAEGAAAPEAGEEAAPVEEVAEIPAEEAGAVAAPEGAAMKKKSNAAVWIVPLVVLVIVAGLLYWYWKRK